MLVREIPLAKIIVEDRYGSNEFQDIGLIDVIYRHGQISPLLVEGPVYNNQYYLVDGYLRLEALKTMGKSKAKCIVIPVSNKSNRVIKRLTIDLKTMRKKSFKLDRIIKFLLNSGFSVPEIVHKTSASLPTVKKHLKSLDFPTEKKKISEDVKTSKNGLIRLYEMNLPDILRDWLIDQLIDKQLTGEDINAIQKVTEVALFQEVPDLVKYLCISDVFPKTRFSESKAKEIVYLITNQFGLTKYNSEVQRFTYEYLKKQIEYLSNLCNGDFINATPVNQRIQLTKQLSEIIKKLRIIRLLDIPKEINA